MNQEATLTPRPTALAAVAAVATIAACATLPEPRVPGEPGGGTEREVRPADVVVPAGYRVEAVATGLDAPVAVAFDDAGGVAVIEAGEPREGGAPPRLLQIGPGGAARVVATGERAPWTGLTWHQGAFYVAASGAREGAGQILRITPDGNITPIVDDLPSIGDHPASGPVIGPDGQLYFGIGAATNAGVVGVDNIERGWVRRFPAFSDISCKDVVLVGDNYRTPNPLSGAAGDEAATGGYQPFGVRTEGGDLLQGKVPCTGAVFRVPLEGGLPELVAWGLRDPFGLAFTGEGRLLVSDGGMQPRGSRSVEGAPDVLWLLEPGRWYGFPDFVAGEPVWRREQAQAPRLFATHPDVPPAPAARLAPRASPGRLDVARGTAFGHAGQAFVAQRGDLSTGEGAQVARVDPRTGTAAPFAVNRAGAGPASQVGGGGLERPIDARFDPSGGALYVVDLGVLEGPGMNAAEGTGVLWRITRER